MSKLQFLHLNDRTDCTLGTLCCSELPTKDQLLALVTSNNRDIEINVGWAELSPKDHFIKAVGRMVASKRLQKSTFFLSSIIFKENFIDFGFKNKNDAERVISVTLSVNMTRPSVYFVNGFFY